MEILGGVNSLFEVVGKVSDGFNQIREIQKNRDAYIRLIYMEVRKNLDMFKELDMSAIDDQDIGSKNLTAFLNNLHTEMLETIFLGDSNHELFKTLKDLKVQDKGNKSEQVGDSVLMSVSFIISKIANLRQLNSSYVVGHNIYKPFKISTRLKNIRKRLITVVVSLSELEAVIPIRPLKDKENDTSI